MARCRRPTAILKGLGTPHITADLKRTIIEGVVHEAANHSVEQLAQEENEMLVGLLGLRTRHEGTGPGGPRLRD